MALIKQLMDFVRIILTITRPYSILFLDKVYRLIYGAKQKLPPINDRLLLIPATELAEKIRKKQLKAEDLMKAYIKRIKKLEPLVNACVDNRYEDALQEAKAVDDFLASGSKSEEEIAKETPLLGIPFSCKESIGVKGMIQMCGIYAARSRRAPDDAVSTALYRKAGAIPVVATNVPELCTWWESANTAFGTTYNPYDNARCAGGSSGGEAAVLAYAGSVMGIGNDLAGSIRVPSAFNGIYGLKPTPGMISNRGFWPADGEEGVGMDLYVGTGPMCRYAEDLPLLAGIMSEQRINFNSKVDFQKIKIYYMEQFPGYLLEPIPDIKAAVKKAVKHFEDTYDNTATMLNVRELQYALEIWESKLLEVGHPPFREAIVGKSSLFLEFIKVIFGSSEHTLPAVYYAAIERRAMDSEYHRFLEMYDALKKKLEEVLEGDAILLIPTHPETAPHHLMTIPKYPNQAYTCIFSVLGLPSVQIPAGLSGGLPIGIQAVSKANNDHLCIRAAMELEKVFGGWKSPSEISA